MNEYTPGPWIVAFGQNGIYPRGIEAPHEDGRPGGIRNIVRWNGLGFPSSTAGQANARLIAAAPDLLAALINLCEADRDDLNDSCSEVWQQANAALNKALVMHTSAMSESK
jgi:hypothetical protein